MPKYKDYPLKNYRDEEIGIITLPVTIDYLLCMTFANNKDTGRIQFAYNLKFQYIALEFMIVQSTDTCL